MSGSRAVDLAKIVLPTPPRAYDPSYMRNLVDRAEQLIASRVGKDEWQTLGSAGVPFLKSHGSNAALAITAGAGITQLTFNVSDADTDPDTALQTGSFNVKASYAASYQVYAYIKHDAAPSVGWGKDNKIALVYLYVNGVEVQRIMRLLVTGARTDATFFVTLAASDVLDVRLNSALVSFNVDMTGSFLWVVRMSQDTRLRAL